MFIKRFKKNLKKGKEFLNRKRFGKLNKRFKRWYKKYDIEKKGFIIKKNSSNEKIIIKKEESCLRWNINIKIKNGCWYGECT